MKASCRLYSLALVASALAPMAALAFTVPPNDGFVTDEAGVLTNMQEQDLERRLREYKNQTSNEIAILLVKNLGGEDINDIGVEVGRAWGIGAKEKSNGILLLASLEDRAVTIQVGYGLEGAVPDIVAKGIIDADIVPNFREARYGEGLLAAIDALQKHIGGEYTADRYAESGSGFGFSFFFAIVLLQILAAFFARSKSWWQGGVVGGAIGLVLTYLYFWWWSIAIFVVLGLLFDYVVSRALPGRGGRVGRGGYWGGGRFGGGSGGGGFGGFGGGSFGGGGASGKW